MSTEAQGHSQGEKTVQRNLTKVWVAGEAGGGGGVFIHNHLKGTGDRAEEQEKLDGQGSVNLCFWTKSGNTSWEEGGYKAKLQRLGEPSRELSPMLGFRLMSGLLAAILRHFRYPRD